MYTLVTHTPHAPPCTNTAMPRLRALPSAHRCILPPAVPAGGRLSKHLLLASPATTPHTRTPLPACAHHTPTHARCRLRVYTHTHLLLRHARAYAAFRTHALRTRMRDAVREQLYLASGSIFADERHDCCNAAPRITLPGHRHAFHTCAEHARLRTRAACPSCRLLRT